MKSTLRMDWQQVVLNGGPPCFHVDHESPDRYCGRAQRWDGHGHDHKFVSFDELLTTVRAAAFKEMVATIAVLPMRGTMNYRRGYEEGVRDAIRSLEAAANSVKDSEGEG